MDFDLEGARKAGYSDAEIAQHLSQTAKFDAVQAKSAGYTDADIVSFLTKPQAPATDRQKLQASTPMRIVQGARDAVDAGAQMLPRGLSFVASAGGLMPNRVSAALDTEAQRVDAMNAANEADYKASRAATGQTGFDAARLVGNVVSPANAAIATRLPVAATALGRVGVGALGGATGAALQPVDMQAPGASFAGQKALQMGVGAATGGVLTPIAGAIADKVGVWAARKSVAPKIDLADVERIAREVAGDVGTKWDDMQPTMQRQLAKQVQDAMVSGGKLDPRAVMRKADFAAEGIDPTLGQVTRDARQFATERNLRQVPGAGDALLQRMEQQGQQMQGKIGDLAKGATEGYQAGQQFTGVLKNYDEALSGKIRSSYQAARASAGKDAELPLQGLAQDAADAVDRFGDKVPSGVVNQLRKYGILPNQTGDATPRKLFTVEAADDLLKTINASGSRTDDATNAALSTLRAGVKKAVTEPGADDVFAPARKLAAQRFALHDAVPALEDAARGKTAPDDFVKRFVLNGKTDEVTGLSKVLKEASPDAYQQARAQIGQALKEAAFGQNAAGDKAMAVERYTQTLNRLGTDKLAAFFSSAEIEQMQRLGRIGAYIGQHPNASPVQTSNNWGALMTLAGKIPGVSPLVGLYGAGKTAVQNQTGAAKALAAELPQVPAQINPETMRKLSQLLSVGALGTGAAVAQELK